MTPAEVVDRFTENELVHMVAYEQLYGPLGGERLDYLFARLGADVVSPHMKRGKSPSIEDHLSLWGRAKTKKTPDQMLAIAKGIQKTFEVEAAYKARKTARSVAPEARKDSSRGDPRRPDGSVGAGLVQSRSQRRASRQ